MSYFRRIIKRTVGGNLGLIKPAITPESIPEYFGSVKSKVANTKSSRDVSPAAERNLKAPDIRYSTKQGVPGGTKASEKMEIAGQDISIEPRTNQESVDLKPPRLESGQERGITAQQEGGMPAQPIKPLPATSIITPEKLREPEPEATLRTGNLPTLETTEDKQTGTEINHMLPASGSGDTLKASRSPSPQFDIKSQPEYGESTEQDHVSLEPQSKMNETHIDVPSPDIYPQIQLEAARPYIPPSPSDPDARYRSVARQPGETVVTVNIGRIEVKALPQDAPARQQSAEFKPSLSLEEYLKQRAKGRKM